LCRAIAGFAHEQHRGSAEHKADRQVDVECPSPAKRMGDEATEDRRENHRQAHDPTPDRPCSISFHVAVEGMIDQSESWRQHKGGARALGGAGEIERGRRGGEATGKRRRAEGAYANQKDTASAEAVGDCACRQK